MIYCWYQTIYYGGSINILTLYSIPLLTLLVHLFTLFAKYDRVVLEISCSIYIVNIYLDIYCLFVGQKANNTINKYTHKKYHIVKHHHGGHSKRMSFAISRFFYRVASCSLAANSSPASLFVTFLSTFPSLFPEWRTFWIAPYFCHIITFFLTKVLTDNSQ